MAQQQDGFFDMRSEDEILAQRRIERRDQGGAMGLSLGFTDPAARSMAMMGGTLGGAVANKLNPPTLSPEEQARTGAIAMANQKTKAYRIKNPNASLEDLGLESQKYLTEELIRAGDYKNGLPLAQQYAQQIRARKQADLEFEKLGNEVEKGKQELNFWNVKETMQQAIIKGDDQERSVFVGKDGSANYTNDQGELVSTPLGQWYKAPTRYSSSSNGGVPKSNWTATQRGQVRTLAATIPNTVSSYLRMADALEAGVVNGSINFMKGAGATESWISDVANTTTALARSAGSFFGVGDTRERLDDPSKALNFVQRRAKANPEWEKAMAAQMPEDVRASTTARARWMAAAAQLAFSRHQTLEPGSHGMSDQDFETEMLTIGGELSDPEAFRQLSIDNFRTQLDNFRFWWESADPVTQSQIMAPAAQSRFNKAIKDFDERYSKAGNWGSAANPTEGLRSGQATEPDFTAVPPPATGLFPPGSGVRKPTVVDDALINSLLE